VDRRRRQFDNEQQTSSTLLKGLFLNTKKLAALMDGSLKPLVLLSSDDHVIRGRGHLTEHASREAINTV
jgi:hypothetical protein